MKKITRFGPPEPIVRLLVEAARAIPGNTEVPTAAPKPDASICNDFLRLIMIVDEILENYGSTDRNLSLR
jgi:hypothetical protein